MCCDKSPQSCLTLCDPVDCSPPGSSVHGILQVRIPEWVAVSFSRDLPNPGIEPGSPALQADALSSEPPGKPLITKNLSQVSPQRTSSGDFFLLAGVSRRGHLGKHTWPIDAKSEARKYFTSMNTFQSQNKSPIPPTLTPAGSSRPSKMLPRSMNKS